MDSDGDHKLQWREFACGFKEMEIELGDSELLNVFHSVATKPSKRGEEPYVDYEELLKR